ncbi:MAG: PAS domain S-box protein, partial [Pyrinomonadaceae bacterium]|nr:PAS domain S-box protein [Pyrinomonadaceae bacterium]
TAVIAVGSIFFLKLAVFSFITIDAPFLLFFFAIVFSAWRGGLKAGIFATILISVLSTYFFVSPKYSFFDKSLEQNIRLSLFVIDGFLMSWICGSRLGFQIETKKAYENLEQKVALRTAEWARANASLADEISHRRLMEDTLRESEMRFRNLADSAPVLIWLLDTKRSCTYVNKKWLDFTGRTFEQEIGHGWLESVPKDDFDRIVKLFNVGFRAREDFTFENTFTRHDGEKRWMLTSGTPRFTTEGEFLGYIGSAIDITERKRTEAELSSAFQRLHFHVENSPLGVIEWDKDFRILSWSPEAERIFGWKAEEVVGKIFGVDFKIVHEDDAKTVEEESIQQLISGSKSRVVFTNRNYTKNGEIVTCQWFNSALVDANGEIVSMMSLALDVTERKRLETEIQNSEAELRALFASMTDVIAVFDSEGNYLRVAPTTPNYLFETATRAIGKNAHDVLPKKQADALLKQLKQAIVSGQPVNIEFPLMIDDKEMWFAGTGSPMNDKEVLWVSRDITERKQMEAELRNARDAALEAVNFKAAFLANMSHEIRTPMNGGMGMTDLLLDTKLSSQQRDFAETIRSSSTSLLTILNDILDFSKIEAGKLHFESLDFDLRRTVEDVITLMAERAHVKRLELILDIGADVPTLLTGDPNRLRQILLNLSGNAVKFTTNGEVSMNISLISETAENVELRFSVRDTGIGINEETRRRLFQPFTQADTSTTRRYGGTGLGLAISKQLVEIMNGDIGVDSEPGNGSTFWFTAHLKKQSLKESKETIDVSSLKGLRVLIVDDNATNRRLLFEQTSSWGMKPFAVNSGTAALAELRRVLNNEKPLDGVIGYDLAILDLQMPGMDGIALAETIKLDSAFDQMRIILLTSLGWNEENIANSTNINALLTKPVRQSQLFDCLANVLNDSQQKIAKSRKTLSLKKSENKNVKILLVEDNQVNTKVALTYLEKFGYEADCARNGVEALAALDNNFYDVILMDCQMPEMDGYTATAIIRDREVKGHFLHRTAIVAMTANAMSGDREKCLAVGMDDYIVKPVNSDKLQSVLEKWGNESPFKHEPVAVKSNSNEDPVSIHENPPVDLSTLNSFAALQEDNPGFVKELVELYVDDTTITIKEMSELVETNEFESVSHLAHKIKGSSATFGALRMAEFGEEIQVKCSNNEAKIIRELVLNVQSEFERVVTFLKKERFL